MAAKEEQTNETNRREESFSVHSTEIITSPSDESVHPGRVDFRDMPHGQRSRFDHKIVH